MRRAPLIAALAGASAAAVAVVAAIGHTPTPAASAVTVADLPATDQRYGIIRMDTIAYLDHESNDLWGSGNAARIINQKAGSLARVVKANILVTTSAPFDFLIEDGTAGDYNRADVSIVNPLGGGIVDPAAAAAQSMLAFASSITTVNGSTVVVACSDAGSAGAPNTVLQRYPAPHFIARQLRVTKVATGPSVNYSAVVVKNGVATALIVTVLAADAVGTEYVISAPTSFAPGDKLDLTLVAPTDPAPGTGAISAVVVT